MLENESSRLPMTTRTIFGCNVKSFVPAPQPTSSGTNGGGWPYEMANDFTRLMPVGVTNSPCALK